MKVSLRKSGWFFTHSVNVELKTRTVCSKNPWLFPVLLYDLKLEVIKACPLITDRNGGSGEWLYEMVEVKIARYWSLGTISLTLNFFYFVLWQVPHGIQDRKGRLGVGPHLCDWIPTSQLKTAFLPLYYLS